MNKKIAMISAAILLAVSMSGCGSKVSANTVHSKSDLEGKIIGTQKGTTGNIFASDISGADVREFNKGADAVEALKNGEVDAVIIDEEPAKVFASEDKKLQILDDPFAVEEYSIAFNKEKKDFGKKLDEAIKTLKDNGTIEKINSHWIGDNADQKSYSDKNDDVSAGKIIMATNAEFPPYESFDDTNVVGIDVDIMHAVCDELNMELEIDNMGFDAIFDAVQSGKADVGAAGISMTPERAEIVGFTQGYALSTQVIITRKD